MMQKNKFALPIETNPYIQAYHHTAFPLSILQACAKDNIEPWLSTKYINLIYSPKATNFFDFFVEGWWFTPKESIFRINYLRVEPRILGLEFFNLIDLFKDLIREGYYISGAYNEFYIPRKNAYRKFNFVHNFFLFGFDDEKKVFLALGYLSDGQYQVHEVTYDEFLSSITDTGEYTAIVNFTKPQIPETFTIDIAELSCGLYDYLHSINSKQMRSCDLYYGIDCHEYWLDDMKKKAASGNNLDIRYSRLFLEHKNLMLRRIKYLGEHDLPEILQLAKIYEQVHNAALLIHNLNIKFNITRKQDILVSIEKKVEFIVAVEKKVLNAFLKELPVH